MEALIPILLIFIFAGFFLYNPIRRKWSGIIGIGGSYLIATGMIVIISLIAAIFSKSARASMDGGVIGFIFYIIIALLTIAYLAHIMMTRCNTVAQRIMLPFVVLILAFGWASRMMASIFFHMPMESGQQPSGFTFPQYLYDDDSNVWELMNDSGDNASYYCSSTGGNAHFYDSDFDPVPKGFHTR